MGKALTTILTTRYTDITNICYTDPSNRPPNPLQLEPDEGISRVPPVGRSEVAKALRDHNTNLVYEKIVEVGPEGRAAIIQLAVDEFLDRVEEEDEEGGERVLLSLVHSSVSAYELGLALYLRGRDDREER